MRRLRTYIVKQDTGLAPNPFWGYCTLAVCTPNHMKSEVHHGEWIAGFLGKDRGHKFLYAMEVSEILDLNDYYHDSRFSSKKPNLRGTGQERAGDNFYSRSQDGKWIQHRNRFHLSEELKEQDTRYARVFIAERFWYLGRSAVAVPPEFMPTVGGKGTRINHPAGVSDLFTAWVEGTFQVGIGDVPNDNAELL